ncbi:fatty acid synthase-like isoform X1 [Neodiprion virginianus]|uniref:fatty acid synthase-like isoform X1 n=2 Tax=Neodiprion virginianus TaxID=2961670 RepID=UPI001EE76882|nr:fatty acid synthase-like isoform X1 [Neodiprion virginianus]
MSEKNTHVTCSEGLAFPKPGDEVVISGIAGRFPESDNLTIFRENLLNKVDLITDDDRRWKSDNPDIPQRTGKVNNIEKFDAEFFEVHFKEAHTMDPAARMILEHTYEAIIDAGVNPRQLRGTNTGVFVGACYSESEKSWLYTDLQTNGLGIPGCCRAMMANRISHWLGCTGPSYTVDTACSSSLFAMDHAYRAIRTGECQDAIVVGCHLCLHPHLSQQFFLLGVLSADGRCKSFDNEGNGYCRSEAVCTIYLQKSKDARRIYAHVVYTKTNCDGYKEEGITFPSSRMQRVLLEQFYEECKISPSNLAFLEAHGTGTKVGDPAEVNAIEKVFCPGRTTPLQIGSIKSNVGHSEPASGLCSVAKIVLAMESGIIPPNINYNRPREEIEALMTGRIQVITEPTPWKGGYVGINSFGFGGGNAHVLLKSNPKEKVNNGAPNDDMPRLVVVSGRTEKAVTTLLNDLESRPVDVEYIGLFHNIHAEKISGHLYRGHTILPARGIAQNNMRDVRYYSGEKSPIWFVFSGMGCEWVGIGESWMKIPVFAAAIRKCDATLKPHGVDIIRILTNKDPKMFDNIINSRVGTAAIQIGLLDVLSSIGVIPDHLTSHLAGELGCAYADGCLTAEQTILAAYFGGLVLAESGAVCQSLAVVKLNAIKLRNICPPDVHIDCSNGSKNSIISGPNDSVTKFIAELRADNICVRGEARSSTIYQTSEVEAVRRKLLAHLRKIIPDPKPRSQKWLINTIARSNPKDSSNCLFSAEFYTSNLFTRTSIEGISHILPKNAVTIDIAPHNLLQAALLGSSSDKLTYIALTNRENVDNVDVLLDAIGKMYEIGLSPKLSELYPDVQYPVSRGTPMISPLIRWQHSEDWYVVRLQKQDRLKTGNRIIDVNLADEEFEWMSGHVIDGRNLVPATGYLALIWQTVAMMQGDQYMKVSVVFENVRFHRATTIPKDSAIRLQLMIHKGSGRFEVSEGDTSVVTGFIRVVSNAHQECVKTDVLVMKEEKFHLTSRDIYKELRLRGYQYSGMCRSLTGASLKGNRGRIAWHKNWAAFMDNMLQMQILSIDTRGLVVPTGIQKLVIDTKMHIQHLNSMPEDNKEFTVEAYKDLDIIVSGGIEIRGLRASAIARRRPAADPVVEKHAFVAHRDRAKTEMEVITCIATQIALENHFGIKIKTVELIDDVYDVSAENLISPLIQKVLNNLPLLQADLNVFAPLHKFSDDALTSDIKISCPKKLSTELNAALIVTHGLLSGRSPKMLKQIHTAMRDGSFMLARESLDSNIGVIRNTVHEYFHVILEKCTSSELIILLRKKEQRTGFTTVVRVSSDEFTWLEKLQAALKVENKRAGRTSERILLVSEGDLQSGLMGLVNCLRREPGGKIIQGLLIQDLEAPEFSLENSFYSEQLDLGLALNVLRPGELWGSYRFFPMEPLISKPVYHASLSQTTRGDLRSVQWIEGMIQPSNQNTDIVQVHYSSINFRDVMLLTGKLAPEVVTSERMLQDHVYGLEFSGRDINGRAVMGLTEAGAFANLCVCDKDLLWPIPDNWSLEDAATVPVVYATAYHALMLSGKMEKTDKVLIHAGSGGVGQAAIALALHKGCEVFTTVGTPRKREFIKNQFPQIDDEHIGNSRDTSFEQLVLRKTQGQGVDIVLNSLAEEKLQASVRCLATGGRFLEIGKFDLAANNPLGMEAFLKGISFHGILLDNLFNGCPDEKKIIWAMLTEGMKDGAVKPLVRTVFPMNQVETALRYMAGGKHIGKVIIKIRDQDEGSQSLLPLALPRYYCSDNGSYLILGGLGGFGLELADWLVLRGAKKLVFTSRKGVSSGYQRMRINLWQKYGVKVVILVGKDASTHEGCEAILKEAASLGPVHAIFNLAVVLKDALYENQTVESFEESFRVKAWATRQMDQLSRTLCPQLRQFVVFSSVSCGRGNAGQTNYGMANSIMERICENRVAEKLPGLAVQWGAVGDVGLVAEMQEDNKEIIIGGTLQQRILSCLQELDGFLNQDSPVVSSMVVAEKKFGGAKADILATVVEIMGLKDLKTVSLQTPLAELGMDSMMAVEIKQTLEREFEVFLNAADIRGLNFAKLQEMSLKKVKGSEEDKGSESKTDEILTGMQILIQNLGTVELNRNVCVPLVTNGKEGEEVFIIPGIEGTYPVLQSLAVKLKSRTTCLQLGLNSSNLTSIESLADYLMPHFQARYKGSHNFVIAGYSFGTLVAIELARRLESEGLSGRLVLIDGSPDHMKALCNQHLILDNEAELQSILLLELMDAISPSIRAKLAVDLQKCITWEEKLTAFTNNVPTDKNLKFTVEEQQAMCSSFYNRIKAILNYNFSVSPCLNTPITLIRPQIQSVRTISEDYGLGSITCKKVEVCYAAGDHVTMLNDDICAHAIDVNCFKDNAICESNEALQ